MATYNYFGQIGLNLMDGWKIEVEKDIAEYKFYRLSPFLEFDVYRPSMFNRDLK